MLTPEQIADKKTEIVNMLPDLVKALGFRSDYRKAELILLDMTEIILELKKDESENEHPWAMPVEVL